MCLCLMLLCVACSKPAVRTESIEVKTPVYVAMPTDLLSPCTVDMPATWTNSTLADYALRLQVCVRVDTDKLERIRKLQPAITK